MTIVWELDFYSRPILDENKKKIWELLICDRQRQKEWVKECPSDRVNSEWLCQELVACMEAWGETPIKVRFFRTSMNNIITRGCTLAGITPQASRRLFAMSGWLKERMAHIYPQREGFQGADPNPLPLQVSITAATKPAPDALKSERWQVVALKAADFAAANEWSMEFSELFDISDIVPETEITGLILYSSRATPLAAWMSGVDPVCVKFETNALKDRLQLILEASADVRWILANYQAPKEQPIFDQGKRFEALKSAAQGVHFLAVQRNENEEAFAGFWLLKEPS
ncbi:MAG: Tab2/Atab2 family RNA-binding protein [Pseudanabaena sp. ELA607]